MFRNVLVGIDGNAGGRGALSFAREIVEPGGKITLVHVSGGQPPVGRRSRLDIEVATRRQAVKLLQKVRENAGIDAELCFLRSASVGEALHRLAESTNADLLVVGSTRHGVIGRVLIADHTWAALDGAPCAVAITPAGYALEPKKLYEVGVAFNGTPESRHALEVARILASEHHAKLSAFQAVSVPTYAYAEAAIAALPSPEQMLESELGSLRELGAVEPHTAYGVPAEELSLFSASVDLLVIGSRGYGPLGRLVHGSITRQLTRLAYCPILLVTRAADDTADVDDHQAA